MGIIYRLILKYVTCIHDTDSNLRFWQILQLHVIHPTPASRKCWYTMLQGDVLHSWKECFEDCNIFKLVDTEYQIR